MNKTNERFSNRSVDDNGPTASMLPKPTSHANPPVAIN